MSEDEHKCHCSHVIVIQTKLTIAQWFIGVFGTAVIVLVISQIGQLVNLRIRTDPPPSSASEKLFLDRVGH